MAREGGEEDEEEDILRANLTICVMAFNYNISPCAFFVMFVCIARRRSLGERERESENAFQLSTEMEKVIFS
jgi:hypothetical protein